MKKSLFIFCLMFYTYMAHAQHNMLGKTQKYIRSFYDLSKGYRVKTDSINRKSVLLSYKTDKQYPFYTYEINLAEDKCISYGIVSKDNSTLKAYLELLDYMGELIEVDSTYNNFTYKLKTEKKTCFFTIKQPYSNSQFLTRRNLFYILITEKPELTMKKKGTSE